VPEAWSKPVCDVCEHEERQAEQQWASVEAEFVEQPRAEPVSVARQAAPDHSAKQPESAVSDDRALHVGAGEIGRLLFYLGLLDLLVFPFFNTVTESVHNFGHMNAQLVGMLHGVALTISGAALLAGRPIRLNLADRIATMLLLLCPVGIWIIRIAGEATYRAGS
jgi:hypothetical protein